MSDYLLDTNHASFLFGGSQALRERIQAAADAEHRFGISVTVLTGDQHFGQVEGLAVENWLA